jgi:excisionase family DNA binding protein
MSKKEEDLITVPEAAALRGVHVESIRSLVKRGRIRSVSKYGRRLLYREDVLAFEKKSPGPAKGTKKGKATKKSGKE